MALRASLETVGSHMPEVDPDKLGRDLWGFKIEIDGDDAVLIGFTCELGADEIGLYAAGFRQVPGEGMPIDRTVFAPIVEYHPSLLDSTSHRAAEIALLVTGAVVAHVERAVGINSSVPPAS